MGDMQLNLTFEPGLTAQFPSFEDVIVAVVYGSRKGLNGVAADLDYSPSELSRRLNRNPDDPRNLKAGDVPRIIDSTGDMRPVYWLIERFLQDPSAKRQQALDQMAQMAPVFLALAEQAGITAKMKVVK